MDPYVTQSVFYSGSSLSDVVEGDGVHSSVQDQSTKKSPHIGVGELQVRQGWIHLLNLVSQPLSVSPELQQQESLTGSRGIKWGSKSSPSKSDQARSSPSGNWESPPIKELAESSSMGAQPQPPHAPLFYCRIRGSFPLLDDGSLGAWGDFPAEARWTGVGVV